MAIPFESSPATVLGKSTLAKTGYGLQQQQKAEDLAERERYEKNFSEISGTYWPERDVVLNRVGAEGMKMFTDPKYINAKIGSPEHNKLLRFKQQYKQLAGMSANNKKLYQQRETFLQNNPDAEGVDELRAYYQMGNMDGEVKIDDYGNVLVDGSPLITSDALKEPPSLRKKREVYDATTFLNNVKVGDTLIQNEYGVREQKPKNVGKSIRDAYMMLDPSKKRDLLMTYMQNEYPNNTPEEIERLGLDILASKEADMLEKLTDLKERELDYSNTGAGAGGNNNDGGIDPKSNLFSAKPNKEFEEYVVENNLRGKEFHGVAIPALKYTPEGSDLKNSSFYIQDMYTDGDEVYAYGHIVTDEIEQMFKNNGNVDVATMFSTSTPKAMKLSHTDAVNVAAATKDAEFKSGGRNYKGVIETIKKASGSPFVFKNEYDGVGPEEEKTTDETQEVNTLNASEVRKNSTPKEDTPNETKSNEDSLNASSRRNGVETTTSTTLPTDSLSNIPAMDDPTLNEESLSAEDLNTEKSDTTKVNDYPYGNISKAAHKHNEREDVMEPEIIINFAERHEDLKNRVKSAYGDNVKVQLSKGTSNALSRALEIYEESLSEEDRKKFVNGESPILLGDNFVSREVKIAAYKKYLKNLKSYEEKGYYKDDNNKIVRKAPPKQAGEKSFHIKGDAIDLAQTNENRNNKKLFNALKRAGFKQHRGDAEHDAEWWHWSIGEFSHEELTDEQIAGRKAAEEYSRNK